MPPRPAPPTQRHSTRALPWLLLAFLLAAPALLNARDHSAVIDRAKRFTVYIEGDHGAAGTGFFISPQGHIATNHHVIAGGRNFIYGFLSGDRLYSGEPQVIAIDEQRDLAILKAPNLPPTARHATLCIPVPSPGQGVIALGYPGALDSIFADHDLRDSGHGYLLVFGPARDSFTPSSFLGNVGKIMTIETSSYRFEGIVHSATMHFGNSGGPLVDHAENVVGINQGGTEGNFLFAIQTDHLVQLARSNNIPISTTHRAARSSGSPQLWVWIALALGAVACVLAMRKPRTILANAGTQLIRRTRREEAPIQPTPAPPQPSQATFSLRGRDPQGKSFSIDFGTALFSQTANRLIIGRHREFTHLHIKHDSISRQHATLTLLDNRLHIADRNSGNGTKVNNREIPADHPGTALNPGDRISLGEVDLVLDAKPNNG